MKPYGLAGRLPIPVNPGALAAAVLVGLLAVQSADLHGQAAPDTEADGDERVEAAVLWLQDLDAGNFEATWTHASARTRSIFPHAAWTATLREARESLGDLRERAVVEILDPITPPGAPAGQYASVTFSTRFDGGHLTETITLVRSDGGEPGWKVFGYQARR